MTIVQLRRAQWAPRVAALVLIGATYAAARLPEIPSGERNALSAQFRFTRVPLPDLGLPVDRSVRQVHPSVRHLESWISSVGASVALNDLDGDGLSNELCLVDPRSDAVIVGPVPGVARSSPDHPAFTPFALDPSPRLFDANTTAPMGCLPGDFNEDGRMDLLVYYWGRTPIAFLRRPDPVSPRLHAHSYAPVDVADPHTRWNTNVGTTADVDGDGHLDVVLGNYFQDGAAMLDARGSGSIEMQDSMSRAVNGGVNRVLRWVHASAGDSPTVRFEDVDHAFSDEVARGWSLAVAAADLDGDGLPEIYFANDFGPDRLLHNRSRPGELRFAAVDGRKTAMMPSSKVLGRDSFKGMGADFADINADGLLDIFVSNIANEYALQESHFVFVNTGEPALLRDGIAPFVDRSEELGLSRSGFSWEARLADFNNDGHLEALQAAGFIRGPVNRWPELQELAMGNDLTIRHAAAWPRFAVGDDVSGGLHNPFFVRSANGRYVDLASSIEGLGGPTITRGIATADVDGDGDLDFAVANQWQQSYLFRNDAQHAAGALGLRLLRNGQPAVGATAVVHLPDGRRIAAHVDGGNGHSGKRSPDVHVGVGPATPGHEFRIDLRWRDGAGRVREATVRRPIGRHTLQLDDLTPEESR